jgi:N-methylhydantoinase A
MRYFGQQNEVTIWCDADPRERKNADWLRALFENEYEKLYHLRLPDLDVEVVSWRLIASGPSASRDSAPTLGSTAAKPKMTRKAHFDGANVETPVYARGDLAGGQSIVGPAIIEERETTIIILPGWKAKVDATGCIMASRG